MIYAYGDDGSDEKKERVISVSVIAGYEDWWKQAEDDWAIRCGEIPFHATDCESDSGDYQGQPHEENKAMYRDLVGILATSRLGGIGSAMDLTARKKIFPNSPAPDYYRAFQDCLAKLANVAENLDDVVEVTFDVSTENEYNAGLLYSYMRNVDGRLGRYLHPKISFVSWKESPRVQMADMLAFEAWKVLRATGRFETLSYSDDWFKDLKSHIDSGELERIVGFNEIDYKDWLQESGRQHCTSNLIHFLGTRKQ